MKKKENFYTRRAFIRGTLAAGLGLAFINLTSCKKSTPEPNKPDEPTKPDNDNDNGDTLRVTGVNIPFNLDVSKGMELTIVGHGFADGDEIVFNPMLGTGLQKITVETLRVTADFAVVVIPDGIGSARYEIVVKRGTKTFLLGASTLKLVFNANIPNKEGMTVKGTIYAAGVGLADVVVSDGFAIAKTDAHGIYYLPSTKKTKYVFVSIPSNYEVATDKNLPLLFSRLTRAEHVVEICDFELTEVNNNDHVVMVLGDMHLANRNNDLRQFQEGFLVDVNQQIQNYKSAGKKVYVMTLGDMSWETYWNGGFALPEYLREMNKINAPVFNTMGNHDHDPDPKYRGDNWGAAERFRSVIGPSYYSFNIGKIHYVVLDDVDYINDVANPRNYNALIDEEQMDWLRKDLDMIVDKSTPIVIAMHIQLFSNPTINNGVESRNVSLGNGQELISVLSSFDNVQIFTGHTHYGYNTRYSSSLMEHNSGAVCATWWWTDVLAGNHISKDGAPGGYVVLDINNKDLKWNFKSIGHDKNYQFRTYDLNKVHITKAAFDPNNRSSVADWNTYVGAYANANSNNEVLINVWNYDPQWAVEVWENGTPLQVTRVRVKDPLHVISYPVQCLNRGNAVTSSFNSVLTAHMFKVQASSPTSTLEIKVTDCFGNVYTETMVRPKEFGLNMV